MDAGLEGVGEVTREDALALAVDLSAGAGVCGIAADTDGIDGSGSAAIIAGLNEA